MKVVTKSNWSLNLNYEKNEEKYFRVEGWKTWPLWLRPGHIVNIIKFLQNKGVPTTMVDRLKRNLLHLPITLPDGIAGATHSQETCNRKEKKNSLLPHANEVCEGHIFTDVCLSTGDGLGLCLEGSLPWNLCLGVSVQWCLCPWVSLSRGSLSGGLCHGDPPR